MSKLKIERLQDHKPVKLTLELPADVIRDLKTYADLIGRESGQAAVDPVKLITPMLKRFMATDRVFRRLRRTANQDKGG